MGIITIMVLIMGIYSTFVSCLIVQKGSTVNARDYEGNTPLSLAVANGHERYKCIVFISTVALKIN